MNIGIFTATYHPAINGVVTSVCLLEQKLIERGHTVHIITASMHEKTDQNCNLHMMDSIPLPPLPSYRLTSFYSYKMHKLVKQLNLDIIHTHNEIPIGVFGKILAKRLDLPIVHTYHTMWEDYLHYIMPAKISQADLTKKTARLFIRWLLKDYTRYIAPSKSMEQYLIDDCHVSADYVDRVPTGISLRTFEQTSADADKIASLRAAYGIGTDDQILLFVGRVAQEKSIDVIIRALPQIFKENPRAKFLLVGDGPHLPEIRALVDHLGISDKVIYTGIVPFSEIGFYYRLGTVFVNASTSETQGLTYMEAMAANLPVVAKKAQNLNEVIYHRQNGLLFTSNDQFPELIHNILHDQELYNMLVKNGQATVQEYSADIFADRIESIYQKAIAAKI